MIPKPIISDQFTLEDIRKIRDYNYEITKDMTYEEYKAHLDRETAPIMEKLTNLRIARTSSSGYNETAAP
jgi:hypothetical protein